MNDYFNAALIEKYSMSGPRYTSYPTAVQFNEKFDNERYRSYLRKSNIAQKDLSLYVHIPFCESVCYFCACNKIITRNRKQSAEYLEYLEKEISRQVALIDVDRRVVQLHFGGGTPTFISRDEQRLLLTMLQQRFTFAADDDGEYGIEIDPRTVDGDYLAHLRSLGFNRLSFGIQDFNIEVQRAVNRIQSFEDIKNIFSAARCLGFASISLDLIYGLPLQSAASFSATVAQVIELSPDRLAVFNYAHLPEQFGAQKQIDAQQLPSAAEKLTILENTINQLTQANYEFIGLDHFAKPDDSLAIAQKNGSLYRNFQGYSTYSNCDLLGFGISAISMVDDCYSQNEKARRRFYQKIDDGDLAVMRGVELNADDIIRRHAITEIMCNLKLDLRQISAKFDVDGKKYFAREWRQLAPLAADKILQYDDEQLQILPLGRLLIRHVAMIFDHYLNNSNNKRFSKVI